MHESVIGTRFASSVVETTTVGDYPAVVPSVAGQIDDLRPVHIGAE